MKTTMKVYYLALVLLLAGSAGVQAQMTIGSQAEPHKGSVLDLKSTTKGLLLPNVALNADLTQFVLDGVAKQDEAKGMLVYNTTDNKIYFWNGVKWNLLLGTGGSSVEEPTIATVECAGLTFMDRNLGASESAEPNPISYDAGTDASPTGYLNGDYYQWGRQADGHEKWNSSVVAGPFSATDGNGQVPSSNGTHYGKFITTSISPSDWRTNKDDNLWNETGTGLVNPCPTGFRVPTKTEWETVNAAITTANRSEVSSKRGMNIGATSLFLPASGSRRADNGAFLHVNEHGSYWSCSKFQNSIWFLNFGQGGCSVSLTIRAYGANVRCVKN